MRAGLGIGAVPAAEVEHVQEVQRVLRVLPALRQLTEKMRTVIRDRVGALTATDCTGSIRATVGAAGLPERIAVEPDWRRRAGVAGLAAAVTEACRLAAEAHADAVAEAAERLGLPGRYRALSAYLDGGPAPADLEPAPADFNPAAIDSRGLARLVDDRTGGSAAVGRARDTLRRAVRDHAETGATSGLGRLTLAVGAAGTVTCDIDPDWLGRLNTAELDAALTSALASALALTHGASVGSGQSTGAPPSTGGGGHANTTAEG